MPFVVRFISQAPAVNERLPVLAKVTNLKKLIWTGLVELMAALGKNQGVYRQFFRLQINTKMKSVGQQSLEHEANLPAAVL